MVSKTSRGLFILFEGLDRCGKTTQARLMCQTLNETGKAQLMHFPDRTTSVGSIINAYLKGTKDLDDHALHLLFTANRWELCVHMRNLLNEGVTLIVDRYVFSGVAFSAAKGLDLDWCLAAEHGLPKPDVVFYMQLDLHKAASRGQYGEEVYERLEFQEKVKEEFSKLEGKHLDDPGFWQVIDADRSIDSIHRDLMERVQILQSTISKQVGTI